MGFSPLAWKALTESDVRAHAQSPDAWRKVYDEVKPRLDFACSLLKAEIDAFSYESGRARLAISTYLSANVAPSSRRWIPPRIVAIRLYEHVRILDEWYEHGSDGSASEKGIFADPLVVARAASVYYRHFGSFRRASQLLEEALKKLEPWEQCEPKPPMLLTAQYLGMRRAECSWAAFQLEGRRPEDLWQGIELLDRAIEAIKRTGSADEATVVLSGKLLALSLSMGLYDAMLRTGHRELNAAANGWKMLAAVRQEFRRKARILEQWEAHGQPDLETSSLRLQGLAIALALKASRLKERRGVDQSLVQARRCIRAARYLVEGRAATWRGGAVQFHLDVTSEVESFVFSLCSDEHLPEEGYDRTRAAAQRR